VDDKVQAPPGTGDWYHTLTMPDGTRTPGLFDHAPVLAEYRLPDSLEGLRVLDVGTFDGYWAFEFERRGATVVALDVPDKSEMDWPAPLRSGRHWDNASTYENFEVAHAAYDSSVTRERLTVYDANPERLGRFDMVFVGSLLLHLRDPVQALESLRSVCDDRLHLVDAVDVVLDRLGRFISAGRFQGRDGRMEWWVPNRRCLAQMVEAAGYTDVEVGRRFVVPFRAMRGGVAHATLTARNDKSIPVRR
jgi:tRNA (mo5U34)-methyltransferase